MATAPRASEQPKLPAGFVTESVTYVPGDGDPPITKWAGHTFHANVPKEITGHPDGTERDRLNHHIIERARDNPAFKVSGAPRAKARRDLLPKTPEQYRAYVADWLKDGEIEHVHQLIARFAKDRELQAACEVGTSDYELIATLFMPRLHELKKFDELSDEQVAAIWISNGFNVLPW
jgi:hypothetical protein